MEVSAGCAHPVLGSHKSGWGPVRGALRHVLPDVAEARPQAAADSLVEDEGGRAEHAVGLVAQHPRHHGKLQRDL